MKKLAILMILAISATMVTSSAFAKCYSNGKEYSEGQRSGPYVCVNGRWKPSE